MSEIENKSILFNLFTVLLEFYLYQPQKTHSSQTLIYK